ncbi:hypothetical protein LCGC14_0716510 [marine sediment metagenome]|uniref:site-specific DNA-methyltransferase (adenine-specific) n=1 Tax=marine sediment metagenome TaxID=412755 RepID=A0A0F9QI05_9ZZZZ
MGRVRTSQTAEREVPITKAAAPAEVEKAPLTTAQINKLPDAAFAIILPGGEKDDDSKTVPRSLRVLPHHTGAVKTGSEHTTLDLPRLRNGLARISQTDLTDAQRSKAQAHLDRHADEVLPSRGGKPAKKVITSPSLDNGGRANPAQVGGSGLLADEPRAELPPLKDSSGVPTRGVVVSPASLAKAILDGEATIIVKAVNLPIGGQRLFLMSGRDPVGIVTLGKAQKVTAKQLADLEPEHQITKSMRSDLSRTQKGWNRAPFYAYPVLKAERVASVYEPEDDKKPKAKASSDPISKIKNVASYDPKTASDAVLREDFRTLLSWAAMHKADSAGFKHDAKTLDGLMAKLLIDAARRGPKVVTFNPLRMRADARAFFTRVANRVKLPAVMLKQFSLSKNTDPGSLTDAELTEAHAVLHRMQRAETFVQKSVEGRSTESVTNMHALIVDEMSVRKMAHPPPPSDALDETSEEFETAKAITLADMQDTLGDVDEEVEKRVAPLFGSAGGKKFMAKLLVKLMPEHKTYVEAFAGGGAVFWAKDPVENEALNDMNPDIAFSWKFAQSVTDEKIKQLEKYNWLASRPNRAKAQKFAPKTDVDRFYKIRFISWSGFFNLPNCPFNPEREGQSFKIVNRLPKAKERLNGVKITSQDYAKVVEANDSKDTFFFFDPPYPGYKQNLGEKDFDGQRFANVLSKIKGRFLVTYGPKSDITPFKKFQIRKVTTLTVTPRGGMAPKVTILIANYDLPKRITKGLPNETAEAGIHLHNLERENKRTKKDGAHIHLFLIGDQAIITEEDGVHEHALTKEDANDVTGSGEHRHLVKLPEALAKKLGVKEGEVTTETDGKHDHQLQTSSTAFDGLHTHVLKIGSETFKALEPGEFWVHDGKPAQESAPDAPPASKLAELAKADTAEPIRARAEPDNDGEMLLRSVSKADKQADPFLENPDEDKTYRYTVHNHWRGKGLHADLRVELRNGKLLIGWTLNTQIPGAVDKPVTTLAEARAVTPRMGEVSKIDWRDGDWALRSRPGADKPVRTLINSQRKAPHPFPWLEVEGATKPPEEGKPPPVGGTRQFPGVFHIVDEGVVEYGVQKPMLHEYFVRGKAMNYRLLFRKLRLDKLAKARHSYHHCMRCEKSAPKVDVLWADGRGRAWFCAKCLPLWKKKVGKMAEVVETKQIIGGKAPDNYNDVHKAAVPSLSGEIHPAMLEVIKQRVLPSSDPQGEAGVTGDPTWLAIQPDDMTPNAISDSAVKDGFVPPLGVSALPKAVRSQVPEEFRYWDKPTMAEAKKTRDALVQAMKDGDVKIDVDAPFKVRKAEDVEQPPAPASDSNSDDKEATSSTEKRDDVDLQLEIPIQKLDKERRLVTGIVLEPGEVDAQKDTISAEVIEKAAGDFLAKFNSETELGFMHKKFGDIGIELRESYTAPQAMKIGGQKVKKGTWIMTVKVVREKLWDAIKAGAITGFSIGGVATTRSSGAA